MSTYIDKTIARVPQMKIKELHEWSDKAHRLLIKRPDDVDACRILAAVENSLAVPEASRLIFTGRIGWEPYNINGCRGFVDCVPVARILVLGNHTANCKDVYAVESIQ